MGMVATLVDLELAEQLPAQGVVGQHSFDRLLDDAFWKPGLEMGERFRFHPSRPT
jgi:hypothetical protein